MYTDIEINQRLLQFISQHKPESLAQPLSQMACEQAELLFENSLKTALLRERFEAVALLRDSILLRCPASKAKPNKPVPEDKFRDEIALMVKISQTMRHSEAYNQWLNLTREHLVCMIHKNARLLEKLRVWEEMEPTIYEYGNGTPNSQNAFYAERESTQVEIERLHKRAASMTSDFEFSSTALSYYSEEGYRAPSGLIYISMGYLQGNLGESQKKTLIRLNTHDNALFDHMAEAQDTEHHEIVHDLGFQLARMYMRGEIAPDHPFYKDAEMSFLHETAKAIIPARIRSGYLAQFDEVVAFEQGKNFGYDVLSLTDSEFIPPQPLINPQNKPA